MSIALAAAQVLTFLEGTTTLQTSNTVAVTSLVIKYGPSGPLSIDIQATWGAGVNAAFAPGSLAPPKTYHLDLVAAILTDGIHSVSIPAALITSIVGQLTSWRNGAETLLLDAGAVSGTQTAWT